MKPYGAAPKVLLTLGTLLFSLLLPSANLHAASSTVPIPKHVQPSNDPVTFRAQEHFYNMEYDKAIREYEQVLKAHPDDPFAVNYLGAAIVFKELNRIGAMDAESFANESFLDLKAKRPLDPEVRKRALELIDRSEDICNARLKANPLDVDALYARGVERGMKSTYMGVGEKAWLAAVRSALAARRDHERVLELDPNYVDAKLVVGMHNYIIGSLNWAYRMAVALAGVGGNKKLGMTYLREVAYGDSLASMDAKIGLALFLRHEQKYEECLKLVKTMNDRYPRNFLAALEYGNTLNAAGYGKDAIMHYEHMITLSKAGKFPNGQPELVAYSLGISARGQRMFELSAQAFDSVATYADVDSELARKATLQAGEMWDQLERRDIAIDRYKKVMQSEGTPEASAAKKRLNKPFRYVEKRG